MEAATNTTVYIVEDSPPLRERLRDLLSLADDVAVVGEAGSPAEAIDGIRHATPQCVVLDYQLEGGTGVDVLQALSGALPGTVFIMLTNHIDAHTRRICEAAGARYFLDKSTEFMRVGAILAQMRAEGAAANRGAVPR
jgi:DNA-binding NarL/FixJ family response regulator